MYTELLRQLRQIEAEEYKRLTVFYDQLLLSFSRWPTTTTSNVIVAKQRDCLPSHFTFKVGGLKLTNFHIATKLLCSRCKENECVCLMANGPISASKAEAYCQAPVFRKLEAWEK